MPLGPRHVFLREAFFDVGAEEPPKPPAFLGADGAVVTVWAKVAAVP